LVSGFEDIVPGEEVVYTLLIGCYVVWGSGEDLEWEGESEIISVVGGWREGKVSPAGARRWHSGR